MKKSNEDHHEFLNAAGAVYAWMCASDSKITVDESQGFAEYLNTLPYVNDITEEDFAEYYLEIFHAFENDFDDAYNRTLTRVEPLKNDKKIAHDLIRVARKALVTDGELEEAEENVLRELCSILEVNEEEIL